MTEFNTLLWAGIQATQTSVTVLVRASPESNSRRVRAEIYRLASRAEEIAEERNGGRILHAEALRERIWFELTHENQRILAREVAEQLLAEGDPGAPVDTNPSDSHEVTIQTETIRGQGEHR